MTSVHDFTPVTRALGEELTAIREGRKLSRLDAVMLLLERTGQSIGEQTLLTYEHATRDMSVTRFLGLAEAYQVPPVRILRTAVKRAGQPPGCPTCGKQ